MIASVDMETYSSAGYRFNGQRWVSLSSSPPHGLGAVGAAAYAEHHDTELLSIAYELGGLMYLWIAGSPPPKPLLDHITNGGMVRAWNSLFEYFIWHYQCHLKMGWPPLPYTQTVDTMAAALAYSLPAGLDHCAKALGSTPKDAAGEGLIKKFSMPRQPTKKNPGLRILPADDMADFARFNAYNIVDVEAESDIAQQIPPLSGWEREIWLVDQQINIRGVQINTDRLHRFIRLIEGITEQYKQELTTITDGQVTTGGQHERLRQWLANRGVVADNMQAGTLRALRSTLPEGPAKRALELRDALGLTSVQKLFAIKRRLNSDGRIRGLFMFRGASRTGRWAGRGPQPQNLPAAELQEWILDACDVDQVAQKPNPIKAISGALRSLFCAAPGHDLIGSDFSAIEAVVLAVLAGEQWRIDVFNSHRKIYEMSASRITGVPFEEIIGHKKTTGKHHPLRNGVGKTAELASGYKGWVNAWKNFGADDYFDSDDDIKSAVLKWRDESPAIVEFWGGQWRKIHPKRWLFAHEYHGVEGASIQAMLNPGEVYGYRGISYQLAGDILFCMLPSGRPICYQQPQLERGIDRYSGKPIWELSYMGWRNAAEAKGKPTGWVKMYAPGGKLTEQIVQATSRDIMAHGIVRLERAGYPIVLHVHDEAVAEVPEGWGSVEEFERILSIRPPWAHDWPILAAGGWRGKEFRK